MSEAPMTVGQTVARARTAAGITIAQVAASTRVRGTVIEAIENDDFRLCGGDVYARGHLKSIATAVGLNPGALVQDFDVQRGQARAATEPVAPVEQPTRVMQLSSTEGLGGLAGTLGAGFSGGRRGPNWTAAMAMALVVIVGVGLVSFLANRPSGSDLAASPSTSPSTATTTPTTATSAPTTTPTDAASPEPSTSASPSDVLAAADGVVVKLTVTGRASWVRATNGPGGKTLYEGTLTKGDTKTFRDKTLVSLVVGNAGAVSLVVNGRDVGAPGQGGQVVKVKFGPGDPSTSAG